jgi:hypothetical protein
MIKRQKPSITLTNWRKLNRVPTNKHLKLKVIEYIRFKDWYKKSNETIREKFPYDSSLVTKLISVTSQQNNLKTNIDFSLLAYDYIKKGYSLNDLNFGIANKSIQGNLKRVLNGQLPRGNKILPFTLALHGDYSQIVIDSHMINLFNLNLKRKSPNKTDIKHISTIIRKLSKELKLTPCEIQASLWSYIKTESPYSREKEVFDYSYYLNNAKIAPNI